jgi:hypothetical protein
VEGICREGQLHQRVSSLEPPVSTQPAPHPDSGGSDFRVTYDGVTFELRTVTPEFNAMYNLLVPLVE